MDEGFLIKNGTVVDGTGSAPFKADVRVRRGLIVQVEAGMEREGRERVVDASGCYVTPGFIEPHNHFDCVMWWLPTMAPMPGYGVTTSINGNCGFSAAPVHDDPAIQREMVSIFSFFEDIPEKPFLNQLPWDWRKWSEYKQSLQRNLKLPVNYAAFVGHISIRLAVMGLDAWDRAASPDEIARMCDMLEDALNAGALGLSSNLLDYDENDRPIPTRRAEAAEWSALMEVIERHRGATLQVIVDYIQRMDGSETTKRIAEAAKGKKVRIQLTLGVPTAMFAADQIPEALANFEKMKADGLDVWNAYFHNVNTFVLNFNTSPLFAQSNNYAWGEVIQAQSEQAKQALLEDSGWRERARISWGETYDKFPLKYPEDIELFESETGAGPTGATLKEYMDRTGIAHPSDALAEWVLDNGFGSILRLKPLPRHEETLDRMFREPNSVGNVNDGGAHGQMFCGIGENVQLLTEFVRDGDRLKIEEAVHIMTGKIADHFGLHDRGTIAVGRAADIVVFDLDEIDKRPEKKSWDVPDGEGGVTYRWSRDPAPMRLTLVNGVATFDQGDFTGRYPGSFIGPAQTPL